MDNSINTKKQEICVVTSLGIALAFTTATLEL